MEPKDYIVVKIEGEYATLRDTETKDELFIALALLPPGTDVGTKLHYEMLEYEIVNE
ncbi:MAG: hypothetical protein IJX93_09080 [Clostridia bacterium]|nr:hypothetical protein [Clostridia bacterium]MBQ8333910.1 hypothetical protein [Clostridia bacterium]MBQ8368984.1 hypothetical protein [Clostridia bacterium]MBQ8512777.1 hypothetical protein [Clostridia bacterium]